MNKRRWALEWDYFTHIALVRFELRAVLWHNLLPHCFIYTFLALVSYELLAMLLTLFRTSTLKCLFNFQVLETYLLSWNFSCMSSAKNFGKLVRFLFSHFWVIGRRKVLFTHLCFFNVLSHTVPVLKDTLVCETRTAHIERDLHLFQQLHIQVKDRVWFFVCLFLKTKSNHI